MVGGECRTVWRVQAAECARASGPEPEKPEEPHLLKGHRGLKGRPLPVRHAAVLRCQGLTRSRCWPGGCWHATWHAALLSTRLWHEQGCVRPARMAMEGRPVNVMPHLKLDAVHGKHQAGRLGAAREGEVRQAQVLGRHRAGWSRCAWGGGGVRVRVRA